MKLRIRGNSVRLRVSQSELVSIAEHGSTEDAVAFGPGTRLTYRLEQVPGGALRAVLQDGVLSVTMPSSEFEQWREPDRVSVEGSQDIGNGEQLAILIEKDFTCLAPREEDQSDLFPNPGAAQCGN